MTTTVKIDASTQCRVGSTLSLQISAMMGAGSEELLLDRTTIKLLFRWDILSREERDSALRELSEELHSKCQANPGMGKFRFY